MSSALKLGIVLLAAYGLAALLLVGLVAIAWHAGLKRVRTASSDLLALRLVPVAGALLFALTVVLPAFLSHEPHQDREAVGPLLLILAAFALLTLAHGICRGWAAWTAARVLLRACGPARRRLVENEYPVHVVDIAKPFIGVIGAWRPRVVAAECVISACTPDEFRQVLAHEAAHLSTRDNLQLLLLLACPDALAWTPLSRALFERWRTEAEFAADQRATGNDPKKRVVLASALIKVARLFDTSHCERQPLTMPVALDDVEGRVRQLLAPPHRATPARIGRALLSLALIVPVAALPLYALVHELIETLVAFGL
ncbi:MAG TPA: M56 family metallopeptidase [Steroidobacteraceae bacterium]|nr:M56 family metallopeptidase [Steroidobacteraceae bacterium]